MKNKRLMSNPSSTAPDTMQPQTLGVRDDIRSGKMSLNAAMLKALRADLLSGKIPPGIKLKIPDLCERYTVSPGAAREALSRLVPEGLVDFIDQRGFRSATISIESLRDITRVRLLCEKEALIDSIRHGDDAWEGDILAAEHRLSITPRTDSDGIASNGDEWSVRHKSFHRTLIAACTSPWLIRLHDIFYDQTERYRFISLSIDRAIGPRAPLRNVKSEHRDMVRAILARDEKLATELMEAHLLTTLQRVERSLRAPVDQPE